MRTIDVFTQIVTPRYRECAEPCLRSPAVAPRERDFEDYSQVLSLATPPIDELRKPFGPTFGAPHKIRCSLGSSGVENTLFGTDSPLGGKETATMVRGEVVIRDTIADLKSLDLPREQQELIYHRNAERVLEVNT